MCRELSAPAAVRCSREMPPRQARQRQSPALHWPGGEATRAPSTRARLRSPLLPDACAAGASC